MLKEGRDRAAALQRSIQQEQQQNHAKAAKLKEMCWDTMAVPEAAITAVGPACLEAGLGEFEATPELTALLAANGRAPVYNMAIKTASAAEATQLEQVNGHTCALLLWTCCVRIH